MRPRRAALGCVAICSLLTLSGCASQDDWSTKADSAFEGDSGGPELNVAAGEMPAYTTANLREPAIRLLVQAAQADNPLLRAQAIEALHSAPDRLEPIVRQSLVDENRGVRFAAAMTVGKLKMNELALLLEPLLLDDSASVRAAAIYGLRRCGREVDPTPIAEMLKSDDPESSGNAALVLGEIGDPSALPLLRHAAAGSGLDRVAPARARVIELQIAEAMVKLGWVRQVDVIRAALFAPAEEADIVALAAQMAGRLKDAGAAPDLRNLLRRTGPAERPAEVRLAATLALAQLDGGGASIDIPLQYVDSQEYHLRAQAAMTLGTIGGKAALRPLAQLLSDRNPLVQVAAAGAILRMHSPGDQDGAVAAD